MPSLIPRLLVGALVAGAFLVPTPASAVTVDEIVALAHAGVTDAVILALIDRDRSNFALAPEQLVALKDQGVSEPVILAMLKSGRDEADRAVRAESDLKTAMYLAERSPGPEVVVIGHGPDTPNGAAEGALYPAAPAGGFYPVPYIAGSLSRRGRGRAARPMFSPYTAPAVSFPSRFQEPVVPPTNVPVIPPVSPRQPTQPR